MKFSKNFITGVVLLVALMTVVGLSGLNFINTQSNPSPNANQNQSPSTAQGMEKASLETPDGINIIANLYKVSNPVGWIIFVHIRPKTKESWDTLARALAAVGYEGLAIDLRGHGESTGGPNGYQSFTSAEEQKSIIDLETAVGYLVDQRSAVPNKISLIGGSIGANLSLELLSTSTLPQAVLLSPGLNYQGIETLPLVKNLKPGQRVFYVASRDDDDDAAQVQKLSAATPAGVVGKTQIYDNAGHGTNMLISQPDLQQLIISFIQQP